MIRITSGTYTHGTASALQLCIVSSLHDIALRRLRLLTLVAGPGAPEKAVLCVRSELASLGVRVRNPERFAEASGLVFENRTETMDGLASMRGGAVPYVPLFMTFPEDIPNDDAYFAKRILGYVGNILGRFKEEGVELENGLVVPDWLLALNEFGADPITQFQDAAVFERARAQMEKRDGDGHIEWLEMELVVASEVDARLLAWMRSCLYAKSSIKEGLHRDLKFLLRHFRSANDTGIDASKIVMRENLALYLSLLWQLERYEDVARTASTPTDLLRMFAASTGSDISLTTGVSFPKLSRRQRRSVLGILESSTDLEEDLHRYRGLWLALGRGLHPGEYK